MCVVTMYNLIQRCLSKLPGALGEEAVEVEDGKINEGHGVPKAEHIDRCYGGQSR